ncbi:ABC transporter substrate-binding protein [Aridibaculum aurantiacum]|uniref:ABC transporter substrate-binding protein n=1 Tax=Aridibaculum aurantiacum TaxID=2810307 RepID=UPI001A96E66E|nr:extracellular solute-binding protein [Aridibaculum aurantiacum]
MAKTILNGITWNHSRGISPLLAVSQRFSEIYPDVEFRWKKRTLQEFADYPIERLTEHYDLLIIDHPWVGCAAATGCVLPLDKYLSADFLQDQLNNSVGGSHESYNYGGHQWALAIDAATPVASYRADLLKKNDVQVPTTWNEVLDLARKGKVAVPAIPIDLLMNFYMFCIAHGKEPFANEEQVIDYSTGMKALETMRELYSLVDKDMFGHNPIAVAELMSMTDDYWYCPFAYGYSNYSRKGYARNVLHYTTTVNFTDGKPLRSTIGGTGLAISAFSQNKAAALVFVEMMLSACCQSTLYVETGGQPGHRAAWESDTANLLTNNYFKNVLPAMQNGYIRPRYNGYLHFQDHAGNPIQNYLKNGGDAFKVLNEINDMYRQSLVNKNSTVLI